MTKRTLFGHHVGDVAVTWAESQISGSAGGNPGVGWGYVAQRRSEIGAVSQPQTRDDRDGMTRLRGPPAGRRIRGPRPPSGTSRMRDTASAFIECDVMAATRRRVAPLRHTEPDQRDRRPIPAGAAVTAENRDALGAFASRSRPAGPHAGRCRRPPCAARRPGRSHPPVAPTGPLRPPTRETPRPHLPSNATTSDPAKTRSRLR
jgi:hypothetical protein